jgi:hypothetical protein
MNNEDILLINDWIKISIRFSGICLNCKQRLNSGEYGYWSRISKSILHESCYNSLFLQSSIVKDSNDDIGTGVSNKNNIKTVNLGGNTLSNYNPSDTLINNNNEDGINIVKRREKKTKCFICDKYIDFNNVFIRYLLKLSEKYKSNLDVLFCFDCLENFNFDVYKHYREKFLSKL